MNIDIKFAEYLQRKGLLEPLIDTYREWREAENYPFQLQDKRIIFQSVFKSLCELNATKSLNEEVSIDEIVSQAKAITDDVMKEYGQNIKEKISNDVIERLEKIKQEKK